MTLLLNYPQKYDNKDNLLHRGENTLPRYAAVNDLKFLFTVMTEKLIIKSRVFNASHRL